jgi:hypothetical protein
MAIRHKRKDSAGYTWLSGDLVEGQIGLNLADGSLHFKKSNGEIVALGGYSSVINTLLGSGDAAAARGAIAAAGYVKPANITEYRGENLNISAGVTVANLSGSGPYVLRNFIAIGTEVNVDVTIDGGSTITYSGVGGQDNGGVVVATVSVPTPIYAATSLLIEISNGTARTAGYLCHVETL